MKKIIIFLLSIIFSGCISKRYAYLENSTSQNIYFYFKEMKDKSPVIKPNERTLLWLTGGDFPKDKFISDRYNYIFFDTLLIISQDDTLRFNDENIRNILNTIWKISDKSENSITWTITDSLFIKK